MKFKKINVILDEFSLDRLDKQSLSLNRSRSCLIRDVIRLSIDSLSSKAIFLPFKSSENEKNYN